MNGGFTKKNDSRGAKRNIISPLPENRIGFQVKKHRKSLQYLQVDMEWAGLSTAKVSEGKRKAHTNESLSPTNASLTEMTSKPFSCGSGLGQHSPKEVDRRSMEMTNLKPKANSIKGKKDFAQNRAILSSSSIAVSPKVKLPLSSDWSHSIASYNLI